MSNLIGLLKEAQRVAFEECGIPDILQPGIIREFLMAKILGHKQIVHKHDADAQDSSGVFYEYLTAIRRCLGEKSYAYSFCMGQLTLENLHRITRNGAFFFGVFRNSLDLEEIWRVDTSVVLTEVQGRLRNGKAVLVNFTARWLVERGSLVFSGGHDVTPRPQPTSLAPTVSAPELPPLLVPKRVDPARFQRF